MKKIILILFLALYFIQPSFAGFGSDETQVKRLLESQVRYANRLNYNKFISTYDKDYKNGDGFGLDIYSKQIKDIWSTYDNIKYAVKIKNITINDDEAVAELEESSFAKLFVSPKMEGELRSEANSIYRLRKCNGKWKVVFDDVKDETTSMLYGEARGLDIKLTVPSEIKADTEYTASLEFTPPEETIAIASIASDKVEYPQKPTQEVFRSFPEDHILERLFTSNTENVDEFIVASIGLTRAAVCDLSVNLSLIGFGYTIKRVNVIHDEAGNDVNEK